MPRPRTVVQLPAGYQEVYALRVTQGYRLLWLNIVALGVFVLWLGLWGGYLVGYHALGAPLVVPGLPDALPHWLGWALVLMVLPLHEWLHGLAMRYFGHQPRYGVKLLLGVLYATSDGAYFWRDQFIRVALAPLALISLVGAGLALVLPFGLAYWVIIAVILNATGALGDLWMVRVARRFEPQALILDEADGMRVFSPSL
ncbi:MAG: DUF3267 domain-containing protein [Anaerolineales bacterium]